MSPNLGLVNQMILHDSVSVGAVRRTSDGYLVADAKVARTGIQEYLGREVGRPDIPVVRVYRPPEEVFHRDAMRSYAHRPVTVDHPAAMVDATTWKAVSVGQTGDDIVRDGESVRVPLVLMDGAAIKAWEAGKRELSMGYTAELVFGDGVTPDGEPYDAVQTNLRMNHLALVDRGRAGSEHRIGDQRRLDSAETGAPNPKEKSMNDVKTRTVLVDGLSVETTDAGAQAITKLLADVKDARAAAEAAKADAVKAVEAKDAELAKRDAEIESLKAKVLDAAALDELVAKRSALLADASRVHAGDYTGKSESEIRKAVVVAKLGDAAVADKSDAYIHARFDVLVEDSKRDPVFKTLQNTVKTNATDHYAAFVNDLDYRTRKQEG